MKFWNWASGKKTVFAALAGLALNWAQAKGWVADMDAIYLAAALTLITGIAVSHKAVKATSLK